MRTRATLLNLTPPAGVDSDSHLVVTLVGETTPTTDRPRISVVPVVDVSGSMASRGKLSIVTRALEYLSGYLGDDDTLALVTFDTHVKTPVRSAFSDSNTVAAFTSALRALRPGSSTNLAGGIRAGLAQAGQAPSDTLARVIVLTDGHANIGDRSPDDLLAIVADLPANVSVSFLGVGTDCDHDLLGRLSAAGGGSYGFIEDADRAADVLGAEIGGLLEIEAHQVVVTVTGRPKYLSLSPALGHAGSRPAAGPDTEPAAPGAVQVRVRSLLAGQTRHLVFPVTLVGPKRPHVRPVTVAEVTVTGLIDDTPFTVEHLPKAHFGADPAGGAAAHAPEVLRELEEAVEFAQVAHAQRLAEEAAAAGDFTAATGLLGGLRLTYGGAALLQQTLVNSYSGVTSYNQSATLRSSSAHALAGSLAGSGVAFDALASRSMGGYTTSGQRDVAAETSRAVAAAFAAHPPRQAGDSAISPAGTPVDDPGSGTDVIRHQTAAAAAATDTGENR